MRRRALLNCCLALALVSCAERASGSGSDSAGSDAGECVDGSCAGAPDAGACDPTLGSCCQPQCAGRQCGNDGCGGSCAPGCGTGESCSEGACVACTPDCADKVCGDDGCGGSCAPGCAGQQSCADGECVAACTPVCAGKSCGDDGCGGSCAPGCLATQTCAEGVCIACAPDCTGKACGDDGCGGSCTPGCGANEECVGGHCACRPQCDGRTCGPDGCGGSCAPGCPSAATCVDGRCVCVPQCSGSACGPDGCGGECNRCSNGQTCQGGACVSAPDPTLPIASNVSGVGELSGLIGSVAYPGFLWAHRDGYSTDPNTRVRLYAMKLVNRALVAFSGSSGPVREFTFNGTGTTIKNNNWEDLALGVNVSTNSGSSLYIGDIGNNSGGRNAYQVYQFAEPKPDGASSTITVQTTWRFQYPASAKLSSGAYPNCETMFLLDRYLYIVTKENQPRVYRFPDNYFASPGTTHTLVQVTNGSTTRVVGAPGNPSYGQFNPWRGRFMMGNHGSFKVWALGSNSLTGDALVRQMLLNPSLSPAFSKQIDPTPGSTALNTEGGTWQYNTNDLVLGTESKMVYLWPASAYEN